jgi:hypothetical protein
MGFFKWHEKFVRKVREKNIGLAIIGKSIVFLALGSIFSIELVVYGYIILLLAAYLLLTYCMLSYRLYVYHKKMKYMSHFMGVSGLLLLMLFVGIQSTQIPFKIYFLLFGVALIIPATVDLIKSRL